MRTPGLPILISGFLMLCYGQVFAGVADTKHNLSVSGPGTVKATAETQICIFCHTPHNAAPNAPLWNRRESGSTYTPYSSSTAVAFPGQPTGDSVLCLSCHDGTIALGEVLSRLSPITLQGGVTTLPLGATHIGTDLSDDHPISFLYSSGLAAQRGELVDPNTLTGKVKLDATGQLQCSSCHDAHDDSFGKFLVMSNRGSALCQSCHNKNYWDQTPHNLSSATWNGLLPDPWPTTAWDNVADNACLNCHTPHSAGGPERLLNYPLEEDNCTVCHNGHVASKDVANDFTKTSRHPLNQTTGTHDPGEPTVVNTRHVECADCHNPHATKAGPGTPAGPLTAVRGINISGAEVDPIGFEYELCFRCHADSLNKPAALTARQITQTNVRLEFETTNPSYHPVAGIGRNPDVPGLIAPLTETSIIACSDCHNSNDSSNAGGIGPNGPHGSSFSPILERQYLTQDNTPESPTAYALCYKCHDRNTLLDNRVGFSKHTRHVESVGAPCNVCHDPHGISATQGNIINNSHLINFDTSVVFPNSQGQLFFEDLGSQTGACYLSCHGNDHKGRTYR